MHARPERHPSEVACGRRNSSREGWEDATNAPTPPAATGTQNQPDTKQGNFVASLLPTVHLFSRLFSNARRDAKSPKGRRTRFGVERQGQTQTRSRCMYTPRIVYTGDLKKGEDTPAALLYRGQNTHGSFASPGCCVCDFFFF